MGLRDRQTIGDGVEDGLDKMGDDVYRLGFEALNRLVNLVTSYDVKLSLDLEKPFGVRIGLEPKR